MLKLVIKNVQRTSMCTEGMLAKAYPVHLGGYISYCQFYQRVGWGIG